MPSKRIPVTMTPGQVDVLLAATTRYRGDLRDYVLYTLALQTGLRSHELAALNCGDVYTLERPYDPRMVCQLRVYKETGHDELQSVPLRLHVRAVLQRYRMWKLRNGQSVATDAPLFLSQRGSRLTTRGMRYSFAEWLVTADIPPEVRAKLTFHSLRHTACTQFYKIARDPRATQRFARHAAWASTEIYTHVSVEDVGAMLERSEVRR